VGGGHRKENIYAVTPFKTRGEENTWSMEVIWGGGDGREKTKEKKKNRAWGGASTVFVLCGDWQGGYRENQKKANNQMWGLEGGRKTTGGKKNAEASGATYHYAIRGKSRNGGKSRDFDKLPRGVPKRKNLGSRRKRLVDFRPQLMPLDKRQRKKNAWGGKSKKNEETGEVYQPGGEETKGASGIQKAFREEHRKGGVRLGRARTHKKNKHGGGGKRDRSEREHPLGK